MRVRNVGIHEITFKKIATAYCDKSQQSRYILVASMIRSNITFLAALLATLTIAKVIEVDEARGLRL